MSSLARERIGRSVDGRPIDVIRIGDPSAAVRVLVVGDIHGDEPAGIAIAHQLHRLGAPSGVALWVIDDLNPDGVAARMRQNAHGVDLNRNFPFQWTGLGRPGEQQYSGPRPLSEPESRTAYRLIVRVRPTVTIWFHQPLATVDESGGSISIEHAFADLTGLRVRRLPRYPGSAVGWQNQQLPGTTAFVVELPGGRLARSDTDRYARAILRLARQLNGGSPAAP